MFTDEMNAQNISFSREEDNLKINIPDPNLYDQFVTRLLNKNLMPDNNHNADLIYKSNSAAKQNIDVKETVDSSYKSPNPFDISKGPTPSDDG
ncbi:hypothetical protein [Legionella sp. W05-934-2]|jgi:hypothetical protein|uniref:hypothetical protein n=1 Tax=Legionella sp. W05-934-2 TaxID=1198649 RepID=UPI003462CD52